MSAPRPGEPLTRRETEVLGLIAAGLGTAGAARELGVSEHSVKSHVRRVFAKLQAKNAAQLPGRLPEGDGTALEARLLLDRAVGRAELLLDECRMLRGQAADRERAVAAVQRVRAEVERVALLLPAEAEGESWVLDQITQALAEERR